MEMNHLAFDEARIKPWGHMTGWIRTRNNWHEGAVGKIIETTEKCFLCYYFWKETSV